MAQITDIWLQLTILLGVAVASHFVIKRFKQPIVLGELLIGIIIGPSFIGFIMGGGDLFNPDLIAIFAQLGAIILLFLIGLDCDLRALYTKKNIFIALGGVVLPWLGGFLLATYLPPLIQLDYVPETPALDPIPFPAAVFVGATLVATSIAIVAAVFLEMGLLRTEVASTVLGAAVVDDVLGLIVLSLSINISSGVVAPASILLILLVAIGFIVVGGAIGAKYFGRLVVSIEIRGFKLGLKHSGFVIALAITFLYAFIAETIGLSAIVGAFVAGTMFANTPLKADFHEGTLYLGAIFTPIFFISMGILVNLTELWGSLLLPWVIFILLLTFIAIAAKVAGCGFPARWSGMSRGDSIIVGLAMAPRGELGLIIALYARTFGIISDALFSIIILVVVLTTIAPVPIMRHYLTKKREIEESKEK